MQRCKSFLNTGKPGVQNWLDNLKLGFGGTKEEMQRLLDEAEKFSGIHYDISSYADIVDAIHVIQTEMGITGTTAKEASETISGSMDSAKAAAQNLITGLGNVDADLVGLVDNAADAAMTAAGNVMDAVVNVVTSPIRLLQQVSDPMNQLVREAERHASALSNSISSVADIDNVSGLVIQYQELTARTQDASLSADELAEAEAQLSSVTDQLKGMYPGLLGQIDAGTEAWDLQLEAILAAAEAQRMAAMAEVTNNAAFMIDDLLELKDAADEAKDSAEQLQEEMSAAKDIDVDAAIAHIKELKDELQGKIEAGEIDFDDTEYLNGIEELRAALDDLTTAPVNIEGLSDVDKYLQMLSSGAITASYDIVEMGNKLSTAKQEAADATSAYSSSQLVFQSLLNSGLMTLDALRAASGHADLALSDLGITAEDVGKMVATGTITAEEAMERYGMSQEGVNRAVTAYQNSAPKVADASEEIADGLSEAEAAAQETHDALYDLTTSALQARYSGGDLREEYNKLSSELDKLRDSGTQADVALAEQQLHMLNLAATNQELSEGYSKMGIAAKDSLTGLSQFLIDAEVSSEDFLNGVQSLSSSVENSFKSLKDEVSISASDMIDVLHSNYQTQQEWWNNLKSLWNNASSDTVRAFILHLYEQGPSFWSTVEDFAKGGTDQLEEAAQEWANQGTLSAEMYAASIWAENQLAEDAGYGFGEATTDGLASADYSGTGVGAANDFANSFEGVNASPAGTALSSSAVTGLKSQQTAMKTAAKTLANGAVDMIKTVAPLFKTAGTSFASQLSSGLYSGSSGVQSAAGTVASYAYYGANSYTGWFYYIGTSMDSGIASGLYSYSSVVSNAAISVAKSAYYAAASALQINSPSKLFRDKIGASITEGMADGIIQNAYMVTDAMRGLAESTVGAYRLNGVNAYRMGSQLAPGIYGSGNYNNTINVTVNGAENPEDYANRLARQLQLQMRMA